MNLERKNRIAELRSNAEREKKRLTIEPKLKAIFKSGSFELISFKESDKFKAKSNGLPNNKWEDKLYTQTPVSEPKPVDDAIRGFVNLIEGNSLLISLYNFNFGLIRLFKEEVIKNWKDLIELDGDEFYCYDPSSNDFLCIEKTEEFISGKEDEGRKWIYELTYSNERLKEQINKAHNIS
jgi:hypothetical protein